MNGLFFDSFRLLAAFLPASLHVLDFFTVTDSLRRPFWCRPHLEMSLSLSRGRPKPEAEARRGDAQWRQGQAAARYIRTPVRLLTFRG